MAFKITCDHIRTLAWVSYLISLEPVEQITGNPEKKAAAPRKATAVRSG